MISDLLFIPALLLGVVFLVWLFGCIYRVRGRKEMHKWVMQKARKLHSISPKDLREIQEMEKENIRGMPWIILWVFCAKDTDVGEGE